MAVERTWRRRDLTGQRGQSIIEFLIMLPLMLGLVVLLVRVNSAIQVSIVNQQYVRAQLLFLAYNSAQYPRIDQRVSALAKLGYNQMLMGMSNLQITKGDDYTAANKNPDAPVIVIGKGKGGSDDQQTEPDMRSRIRIRTTASLCTPVNVIRSQNGSYLPLEELAIADSKGGTGSGQGARLQEGVTFDYCRAPEEVFASE